jgi:replicative DNA helicase
MKDPLPPNDVDAERAVLGSILIDGSTEIVRRARTIISPEDFYSEKLGTAFEGMCALAKVGTNIDVVILMSWLDANKPGVVSSADLSRFMVDTPTASNMAHYAKIVFEASTRRQLIGRSFGGLAHNAGEGRGRRPKFNRGRVYSRAGKIVALGV